MNRRILVTSTDLMMIQFLVPHIRNLSEHGYIVDIACSEVGGRLSEVKDALGKVVNRIHQVRLHRNPLRPENILGYQDMKRVVEKGNYDIIWTNEPVMGVVTRLVARKARRKGTKVLYIVHGFHFYKGAPIRNWLLFYPIEKVMLELTDVICTVNREDCRMARRMRARDVRYIHGIGINTGRLAPAETITDIRKELNLEEEDFIVLSVGELNENKNQKVILDALHELNDPAIHYILCGKGDQLENLKRRTEEYGLEDKAHFLGYRKDIFDICRQCDVYVMPSRREGLPVSSLEAMYCGLPLVTSGIRGLVDVVKDHKTGIRCNPGNPQEFASAISYMKNDPQARRTMGKRNKKAVKPYCIDNVKQELIELIDSL